jgi:hypothetical protein
MTEEELDDLVEKLCEGKTIPYQNGVMALSVNIKRRLGLLEI